MSYMLIIKWVILFIGAVGIIELWGRVVKKWKTNLEPRPFHPYFVSGDFIGNDCSGQKFFLSDNGPIASGYDFVSR